MSQENGKFTISFADLDKDTVAVQRDGIFIGRLERCEISLDHTSVSRIHAGINYLDSKYTLVNLSSSNVLTLNGRLLGPQKSDVLADGDTIQIGPFTIAVGRLKDELILIVEEQFVTRSSAQPASEAVAKETKKRPAEADGVLKVFWEKRTRDKEDWGTRLRPTEKPKPGKAMFNWRPTRDLRRPWRAGLFVWAFLLLAAAGGFAYLRYPETYAPKPLSNPHAAKIEGSTKAVVENGNSCTTCHMVDEPVENSCIRCHQAHEFHATNTRAHETAGITCTVCHKEHQGSNFDITASAIQSCAQCHNDANTRTYNGKTVHTAHGGSYGYPVVDGVWKWKGIYREVADAIPEVNSSATGDKDEQARISRYFHTVHLYRLKAPEGLKGDKRGLVTCSTCHKTNNPVDKVTPRQTCAACHTSSEGTKSQDARFTGGPENCISCHVQHPYSADRWSEFLTSDALERRKTSVTEKIKQFNGQ
jgi:predicted CXXCH cytochrome family protein